MKTLVLPLGILPTSDGNAFALLALFPDGRIGVELDSSWAAAGQRLATKLSGAVECDASLATVAARVGWAQVTPNHEQLLMRAGIALCFANQFPPEFSPLAMGFCAAWAAFHPLRLWEHIPAETVFPVARRTPKGLRHHAVAILGQSRQEYGLAFYEDRAAFDAMWNGEPFQFDGFSVLADDSSFLEPAFQALGVPPPVLTLAVQSRPRAPDGATLQLARAVMELLTHTFHGGLAESVPVGDGSTVELVLPEAPKRRAPAKKKPTSKKAATKAPTAKKPAPRKSR